MNNKMCNKCGQTNLPNAEMCVKCGSHLPQADNNPFNQPPKTIKSASEMPMFSGASAKPEAAKKSNKLYWILGGVGALVLFGGFLIVNLAAGIIVQVSRKNKDGIF